MLSLVQVFVLTMAITIPSVTASTSTSTTAINPAIRLVLVRLSGRLISDVLVVWSVVCVLLGAMIMMVGCSGLASSGGVGGSGIVGSIVGGSVGVVGGWVSGEGCVV